MQKLLKGLLYKIKPVNKRTQKKNVAIRNFFLKKKKGKKGATGIYNKERR